MELTIGDKKYRVCFRHITSCSIKEIPPQKGLVTTHIVKCHPSDKFDPKKGKVLAFKECMKNIHDIVPNRNERREVWTEFFRKLR